MTKKEQRQSLLLQMISAQGMLPIRTLASRLALQPRAAVEYVIVHEYCHFVHPNHQKEFWALVEQFLPDWKARRALLRQG